MINLFILHRHNYIIIALFLFFSCQILANDIDIPDKLINPKDSISPIGYSTPKTYPNMITVWSEEFDSTGLDNKYWNFHIGNGCPNICGWGNNELEFYKKENTIVKDGYLIIEAKSENYNNNKYTSSRISTYNKINFKYGRIDVRAKLPSGQGIWPAIWMLGKNREIIGWPKCGEIDIAEMIGGKGRENTVYGTTHWDNNGNIANYGKSFTLKTENFYEKFHVFSILWNQEKINWYVDDIEYNVIDITPTDLSELKEEFFLIINLAVGGNWPGIPDSSTKFPQKLIIDYIRVFK